MQIGLCGKDNNNTHTQTVFHSQAEEKHSDTDLSESCVQKETFTDTHTNVHCTHFFVQICRADGAKGLGQEEGKPYKWKRVCVCVFIAPTRQIRGHEHWVKSIHSDGALTSPWLCASESRSRLLRFHSRLFQNESCEFHTFNHPSSRGYCSGAIPWWVISLGQYSTTHRHNTCNNQHACMTATHLLHS